MVRPADGGRPCHSGVKTGDGGFFLKTEKSGKFHALAMGPSRKAKPAIQASGLLLLAEVGNPLSKKAFEPSQRSGGIGLVMAPDVDAAKMWRALEAEALAFAEQITDPEARRTMLIIAEGYRRLAEHADKRDKPKIVE